MLNIQEKNQYCSNLIIAQPCIARVPITIHLHQKFQKCLSPTLYSLPKKSILFNLITICLFAGSHVPNPINFSWQGHQHQTTWQASEQRFHPKMNCSRLIQHDRVCNRDSSHRNNHPESRFYRPKCYRQYTGYNVAPRVRNPLSRVSCCSSYWCPKFLQLLQRYCFPKSFPNSLLFF